MAIVTYANQPTTTVSNGGTGAPAANTSEQWTVTSSALFPSVSASNTPATYFCVADTAATSEIMAVTAITSNVWGVTRGFESTTPVTHSAGFTVMQVVTAGNLENFKQASNAITTPITVANSAAETVIATYSPVAADIEAGVTFEAVAFGVFGTGGSTANRVLIWRLRWGGLTGTVLCELDTSTNAVPISVTTVATGSSFDVSGTVTLLTTTSATSNINMWYNNAANLTTTASNATCTNATTGGASSTAATTISGSGPLVLTFQWGGAAETYLTLTATAPLIFREA